MRNARNSPNREYSAICRLGRAGEEGFEEDYHGVGAYSSEDVFDVKLICRYGLVIGNPGIYRELKIGTVH